MMTPLDIHNKVFGRAFRGYRMDEVDAFLDEIIRDFEALYRENADLKDTVARMTDEAVKNREISMTLEKTMVLAQRVYEEEAQRAKKEADIIIREADRNAEKLIDEAQKEVLETKQNIERLRLFEKQLYLKHRGFLDFQMELLDGYRDKEAVLTDGDMEKLVSGARERDLAFDDYDQAAESARVGKKIPDVVSVEDKPRSDGYAGPISAGADINSLSEKPEVISDDGDDDNDDAFDDDSDDDVDGNDSDDVVDDDATVFMVYEAPSGADEPIPTEYRSLKPNDTEQENSNYKGSSSDEDAEDANPDETDSPLGNDNPFGTDNTDGTVKAEESPFVVNDQVNSVEQVVLLAQKMEEALKALDTMYGETEENEA